MSNGGETGGIKLNHQMCTLYKSVSHPVLSMRAEMCVLWRLLEGCSLCSTGQPQAFWGPLMKFNLGSSFLALCQPSTHNTRYNSVSTKHESASLKHMVDIKAKKMTLE